MPICSVYLLIILQDASLKRYIEGTLKWIYNFDANKNILDGVISQANFSKVNISDTTTDLTTNVYHYKAAFFRSILKSSTYYII